MALICPECHQRYPQNQAEEGCRDRRHRGHRLEMDPLTKCDFGGHRIVDYLGEGGQARVYKVHKKPLRRHGALKILPGQNISAGAKEDFVKEASVLSTLCSVHTVKLFDFSYAQEVQGGLYYLLMELAPGVTLDAVRRQNGGSLKWDRMAGMAIQICHALAEAHEKGVIHRDIKPGNLMVDTDTPEGDFVRVLDFGMARVITPGQPGSMIVRGTTAYAPVEQLDAGSVDSRVDVYALGVVIYEALIGTNPFRDPSSPREELAAIRHAIEVHTRLVPPPLPPDIAPPRVSALVARMLAKPPADRPLIKDVRDELRLALQEAEERTLREGKLASWRAEWVAETARQQEAFDRAEAERREALERQAREHQEALDREARQRQAAWKRDRIAQEAQLASQRAEIEAQQAAFAHREQAERADSEKRRAEIEARQAALQQAVAQEQANRAAAIRAAKQAAQDHDEQQTRLRQARDKASAAEQMLEEKGALVVAADAHVARSEAESEALRAAAQEEALALRAKAEALGRRAARRGTLRGVAGLAMGAVIAAAVWIAAPAEPLEVDSDGGCPPSAQAPCVCEESTAEPCTPCSEAQAKCEDAPVGPAVGLPVPGVPDGGLKIEPVAASGRRAAGLRVLSDFQTSGLAEKGSDTGWAQRKGDVLTLCDGRALADAVDFARCLSDAKRIDDADYPVVKLDVEVWQRVTLTLEVFNEEDSE